MTTKTTGVILVVDSTDEDDIEAPRSDLWSLFRERDDDVLKDAVLLVFANRQDRLNALTVIEVKCRMKLETRVQGRRWHVQGRVAMTGEGLVEGMEWMAAQLSKKT